MTTNTYITTTVNVDNLPSQESMRASHKVRRFRVSEKRHVRTVRTQSPRRAVA